MIPNPDSKVKDFHGGLRVSRRGLKMFLGKCAGCGSATSEYDHLYGWYVCEECNSDDVAASLTRDVLDTGF